MKAIVWDKTTIFRLSLFGACLLFSFVSTIVFLCQALWVKAFMSALSILYVFIPYFAQKLCGFRIQTPLFVFVMIYTICPLLGYSYDFYHVVPYWDKLMHGFAGVIFAMFGAYLPTLLNKNKRCSVLLCALFGLFFSIAISVVWEFVEYGLDTFFHTDMQKDRWLQSLNSYLLGEDVGEIGVIGNIESVIVNGEQLQGFIDIGLIDTMADMFLETVGAAVYTLIYILGKGKRFVFVSVEDRTSGELPTLNDHALSTVEGEVANSDA